MPGIGRNTGVGVPIGYQFLPAACLEMGSQAASKPCVFREGSRAANAREVVRAAAYSSSVVARLEDRLLNHPLRGHIDTVRSHVSELDDEAVAAADEHAEGAVARVAKVMIYLEGALATADPALTTASGLTAIESALTNAANVASQLKSNPEFAATLDQHMEEALVAAGPLAAASPLIAERAGAAKSTFDTALSETVKDVESRASALSEELAALEERRTQASSEHEQAEEQRRQEFSTAMDALKARVDEQEQRADQLLPTLQTQFDAAQKEQQDAFDSLRDGFKDDAEATVTGLKESAEKTGKYLTGKADEVLVEVRARQDEVEELYGVITDTSTTGAFRDEASAQKKAADRWRWVAVGFGVLAALIAVGSIVLSAVYPDETSGTSAVVAKVTATLVAAGIAAYAGRQSGRHREREEEAKRLELELVAFPPFIESLDEGQKRDVRKEFADRAFRGRPAEPSGKSGWFRKEDSFGVALPDLIAMVVAAVKRSDQPPPP